MTNILTFNTIYSYIKSYINSYKINKELHLIN